MKLGKLYILCIEQNELLTWKNIKTSYKNDKFKISAPQQNEVFELADGSYSVSDIQHCFEYIIKKHETVTNNPSITIYINEIENRVLVEMKTGHYLKLLTPETMKLLGSAKSKITKDEMVKMCLIQKLLKQY